MLLKCTIRNRGKSYGARSPKVKTLKLSKKFVFKGFFLPPKVRFEL